MLHGQFKDLCLLHLRELKLLRERQREDEFYEATQLRRGIHLFCSLKVSFGIQLTEIRQTTLSLSVLLHLTSEMVQFDSTT